MERHFAATTYLINNSKLVFVWHEKLKAWLPPGGHVEAREAPHEAAIREIMEETGITEIDFFDVKPFVSYDNRTRSLPEPYRILEEKIADDHFHIDFIYFARTNQLPTVKKPKVILVSKEQLKTLNPVFKNVRILGFEALTQYERLG